MTRPTPLTHARRRPRLRTLLAPATLAGALLFAGCGGDDTTATTPGGAASPTAKPTVPWTLVLDYEPNAVHAGLLRANEAGYFKEAGIELKIVAPSSTSDALTQVGRGKAQIGLADLIDVARRNERALDEVADGKADVDTEMVSVAAALVQRPLSGLIVDRSGPIKRPSDLEGKKIAVSGLPSDTAVIDAMVRAGDKALPTKNITLGFNGLKALSSGRVDATTAYWPADSVTYEGLGKKPRVFALDDFGGPRYPGLVAFTSRKLQVEDPLHVAGFQAALGRGIQDVITKPEDGLAAIAKAYPELDAKTTKAQLDKYVPLFGRASDAAELPTARLEKFTQFAEKTKLTSRRLTTDELTGNPLEPVTP
ncbi:MAG: ABC transporter substrate-binding protein [Solirubrobacteraceae bacterium]|nr:ABC transporter substrate-binding protein [Solirubrobacteraceae bacterium]